MLVSLLCRSRLSRLLQSHRRRSRHRLVGRALLSVALLAVALLALGTTGRAYFEHSSTLAPCDLMQIDN